MNIKGFDSFVKSINEEFEGEETAKAYADGDKSKLLAKTKRIITGTHVGFDPKEGAKYPLTALGQKNFDKIVAAWKEDKDSAAEILRSIIIKERDSQFKFGVAAIMSGIALGKFGIDSLEDLVKDQIPSQTTTPTQPATPAPAAQPGDYTVVKGDSVWKIAKSHLPEGSPDSTINDYMYKIINANKGMDPTQVDALLKGKEWVDPDFIKPGMKLILPDSGV